MRRISNAKKKLTQNLFEYVCPKLVFTAYATANPGYESTKLCIEICEYV